MTLKKKQLLVITSYPARGITHGDTTVGIASYAKNTLLSLSSQFKNTKITVLCEKLEKIDDSYTEKGIVVKRIWQRNSIATLPKIFIEIVKNHREADSILIEFEHSMFGSFLYLFPFPLFLVGIKLLRKKIIIVSHQVIPNMQEIGPHINIKENSELASFMNLMLGVFYRIMLSTCSKMIVFEEKLKTRLSKYGDTRKIVVIPHGVEQFSDTPTKKEAREKLEISQNSFMVLHFGFIGWYKGTDWIIHAIKELKEKYKEGKQIELVIAGGENPNHIGKPYYTKYVQSVTKACEENGITLTGFVPENKISYYFQAADLVILPYRTFMSASGPFSLAMSFKKPFLLSPKVKDALDTKDVKELLAQVRLREEDVHFTDFNGDLSKKIVRIKRNTKLRTKIAKLAREIAKARSWNRIGQLYYAEFIS